MEEWISNAEAETSGQSGGTGTGTGCQPFTVPESWLFRVFIVKHLNVGIFNSSLFST